MEHKSGFVNIIGNPNVGKSTLMNTLVGERLSIITAKSQTTRHRILGIVSDDDYQIVYSDTPGIIKPGYKLQESMMKFISIALRDADIILYVTDVIESYEKNIDYIERVKKTGVPVLVLINKIDLSNQEEVVELINAWKVLIPHAEIIPISATKKFQLGIVQDRIKALLPEGPAFYPKDQLTDKTERFFVSEIIREKILIHYKEEVPYSVEVEITEFKEEERLIRIYAVIYVVRESQKGIVIGHQGRMLKKVGTQARLDMEEFFDKKVFLQLEVKVSKNWRDNSGELKNFGYDN